tara:strand:- start:93 stop:713 length:621 start_codon:yes stop_codon:yes gene_type:complete
MINITSLTIIFGFIILIFSIINGYTLDLTNDNANLRAEALASVSAIFIIGLGLINKRVEPNKQIRAELNGKIGFFLIDSLSTDLKEELAWGSQQILTATAAATVLINFEDQTILKRGLISDNEFTPGKICRSALTKSRLISLVNTKNYPGSYEFDSIIEELPSVIIFPIEKKGFVIVGGWSARCFTKSDEVWISGWTERLTNKLIK